MKRYLMIPVALCAFFSCSESEVKMEKETVVAKYFYAETPTEDTKTYIDSRYDIHWTADDRISVFCSSENGQYRFTGKTGDDTGTFENLSVPASPTYSRNYAVYPFQAGNASSSEGTMTVELPAMQIYAENSFGLGANTMVAVTQNISDNTFKFRNTCGYLMLKLYGGDKIKSITLRGNSNEKIAGSGTISAAFEAEPSLVIEDGGSTEISLNCPVEGISTDESSERYTPFWMVIPPTTFANGFTIEITNTDDNVITKSTAKSVTISRNGILKMAPVKVGAQNARELLSFSLSDGKNTYTAFDISNGYANVQVPGGTDMTNMSAIFTYNGESVKVNDVPQTSGVGTQDFSDFVHPLTYVVTSKSGATQSYIIRMFNLPIIFAATPDGKPITSKTVWTEGCTFKIRQSDGTVSDCGQTSIKGRGNSTWAWYDKKPYAIKFGTKQPILGMKENKRWCLLTLNPGYHYSNSIGFELGKRTEALDWTSSQEYVELFLNGEHRGLYTITEQIKVDKNRVNITEMSSSDIEGEAITGGYLLTYDNDYDEVNKFKSQYFNMPVMFKDPDEDVLVTEQFNYLKDYVNNFEASLKDDARFAAREYLDYFDIDSYIDMWFVWEMAGDTPCSIPGHADFIAPRSVYFHKDRSSKIKSGPVWDFNESLFYRQLIICTECQYYGRLFEDPYFVARVKAKWPEFKARVKGEKGNFESIIHVVDIIRNKIYNSSLRDWDMWWTHPHSVYKYTVTPDEQYTLIHDGIYPKLDYLESYINSLVIDYDNMSGGNENVDDQDDQTDNFGFTF